VFRGVQKLGFKTPTPVQRKSLPVVLSGADAVCMARTGSGKTVAFLIPVLERLLASGDRGAANDGSGGAGATSGRSAGACILSPTRELSLQTLRVLNTLGQFCGMNAIGIHGGESMEKQFSLLGSQPDVVVATPGRLSHHLSEIPDFHLRQCETVVFDEADRLFEMGFAAQLRQICSSMPENRQTLLFSATMPKVLMEFTRTGMMRDPVVVRLDQEATVSADLRVGFVTCRSDDKDAVLLHLMRDVLPISTNSIASANGGKDDGEDGKKETKKGGKKGKDKKKDEKKDENKDDADPDTEGFDGSSKKAKSAQHQRRGLTLIFAATRHHVEYLCLLLNHSGVNATHIYGNMDQSARTSNLAAFRSGDIPVLVVTDVAARGIDVPLIDHVVHYAFPPSAKLFVHRSGRAARAGRIGYCWGLVDPDEMPYMVDLHVFLGRRLSTGYECEAKEEGDGGEVGEGEATDPFYNEGKAKLKVSVDRTYGLLDMNPEMVHYGKVPESVLVEEVENVRRIVDSELAGSHDAEMLRNLARVCQNAMKQYRRSRPEASKAGVRRAKNLLEGEKESGTGRRVMDATGLIPAHPLLHGIEIERVKASFGSKGGASTKAEQKLLLSAAEKKMSDLQKREEFLRAMANYRPKETVFEAFATGGVKELGVVGQVDRGRTSAASAATRRGDSSKGLMAMKSMRRQMKIARDKGHSLVVAGGKNAKAMNGDVEEKEEDAAADGGDGTGDQPGGPSKAVPQEQPQISKMRLSKSERRKMKKDPAYKPSSVTDGAAAAASRKPKRKRGADFRDTFHFIENDSSADVDAANRSRQIEAAMQPSASSNDKGSHSLALRIEENMLDIVGDENEDLVKRTRMMRWDKSKKKYMQTTVGEELSGESKTKKIRLESGKLVKSDKAKIGELYEKWQKKTNRSIGRVGVFDDVTTDDVGTGTVSKGPKSSSGNKNDEGKKSAAQIRKDREKEQDMKLKNMKKGDRRQIERKQRSEREAEEGNRKKGYKGKKGKSIWKNKGPGGKKGGRFKN